MAKKAATILVVAFFKLAGGQSFELQVSQSLQNGHADLKWTRGAAFTAKAEGLWEPQGGITAEDVRPLQSSVEQFTATAQILQSVLRDIPLCKESWACWVVRGSPDCFLISCRRCS